MTDITGPLFKWFGTKWNASRRYPKPRHEWIFEPYAGSAGYSLRHHTKRVVVYEANQHLASLWCWLINEARSQDILQIPIGLPVGANIQALDLSEGQKLLLKSWQRTNNVGNCWTTSPWGNLPGQWTTNTRRRVAREIAGIKHWQFREPTFEEVGTYFMDPPYQYNYNYKLPVSDYSALAQRVRSIPQGSQILCCEAICQKTGKVPDYLPFVFFRSQVTSRRKSSQNHHSKELLYYVDGAPKPDPQGSGSEDLTGPSAR